MSNSDYWKLVIIEAKKSVGLVSPNPAVGAVLVKNNTIIGFGHTQIPGKNHAEIEAIKKAKKDAKGSDLFVTFEPCCHFGRTGPCTDAIIKAGIKKVFIGMKDPNPLVSGRGISQLKKAGIKIELLSQKSNIAKEIRAFNQPFIKSMTVGLPYVVIKAAISLDGKIATKTGDSKWITNETARADARLERSLCDAVIVGAGTVVKDNPELAPHGKYKHKKLLRDIIDGQLSCDIKKQVFRDDNVLVACADSAPLLRRQLYDKVNIHYRSFGAKTVDIEKLLAYLASQEIRSVYVEGGSAVHGAFFDAARKNSKIIDSIIFYIAPKIIGGVDSVSAVGGIGIASIGDCFPLNDMEMKKIGSDWKFVGHYNYY